MSNVHSLLTALHGCNVGDLGIKADSIITLKCESLDTSVR